MDKVFRIVSEKTKEPVESPIDKALQSGKTECGTEYDTLISRKGTECPIAVSAAPIRNSEEAVVGAVVVIRDVSREREIDHMKNDFSSSVQGKARKPSRYLAPPESLHEELLTCSAEIVQSYL